MRITRVWGSALLMLALSADGERDRVRLASRGLAILMISSELPEVLGLSDRVIVLREGQVAAEISRENATAELVMAAATGGH